MSTKKIFGTILFLVLFSLTVFCQSAGWYFSGIKCHLENPKDSTFWINSESKIWKAAVNPGITMYDNAAFDIEYRVRMTKAAAEACFKDSLPIRNSSSYFQMNFMENGQADTCYVMSYSTLFISKHKLYYNYGGPMVQDTSLHFLIPLSEYAPFLTKAENEHLHNLTINQFSKILGGNRSGDTIYRKVRFTCDSNEYLPQAGYINILHRLGDGMLIGEYKSYPTEKLSTPLSKFAVENKIVSWDSTNQVEDPNNPGTFIFAPIKTEGMPKSLIIYEKWIPFNKQKLSDKYVWPPNPYIGYAREVVAYGLMFTNGNVIWFSAASVNQYLEKIRFNQAPYQECYRAERFKTFNIQFY